MAKSKIIRDLANGEVDTITALKRAKVLVSDLNNDEISEWLDYEISGYPKEAIIPSYRKVHGSLMGSYFKGSMASHMTWVIVGFLLMGTVRGPYKASRAFCRQLDTVGALKTHIVLLIRLDFLVNSGPCRRTRGVTDCMPVRFVGFINADHRRPPPPAGQNESASEETLNGSYSSRQPGI